MAELSVKLLDQKSLREKLSLWDTNVEPKAQLTDRQKDILTDVSSQAQRRPLPIEVGG